MTAPIFSFDFSYLEIKPNVKGSIKSIPEHFVVEEHLPFEPCGEGEHEYLFIEKRGMNTEEVAKLIARHGDLNKRDVSSAGLKDKWAVTRQWFSATVINKEVNWQELNGDKLKVLKVVRHNKKLRKGVISHNSFKITVADFSGEPELLLARIEAVKVSGIPNYYGEQRFGNGGQNLEVAQLLFTGQKKVKNRHLRGIYLSAARSYLFNLYLSQRLAHKNWNQRVSGDVYMLDGSHSIFKDDQWQPGDEQRIVDLEIHPTGPLVGQGTSLAVDESLALESRIAEVWRDGADGLEAAGLKQDRRSLRVVPQNMNCLFEEGNAVITFDLPSGCFATSVLRELICYS